jgi:DNA-directed RNA polymerase specialized sigma24 family protein
MAAWEQQLAGGEGERALSIDQARALAGLEKRDREIILAVFMGETRDDVARFFGTSRANVDQKIARFRKQHQEDE